MFSLFVIPEAWIITIVVFVVGLHVGEKLRIGFPDDPLDICAGVLWDSSSVTTELRISSITVVFE